MAALVAMQALPVAALRASLVWTELSTAVMAPMVVPVVPAATEVTRVPVVRVAGRAF